MINKLKIIVFLLLAVLFNQCEKNDSSEIDNSPPVITGNTFINDESDISIDIVIEVVFNEQLLSSTINSKSVFLEDGEIQIEGEVLYDHDSKKIIFTPNQLLQYYKNYVFSLTNEVTDLSGNNFEGKKWQFKTVPETENGKFIITFTAIWSNETHPIDFPPNPHFSGLIGMIHNSDVKLFQLDDFASPGIKDMAEKGSKTALSQEIQEEINKGTALTIISEGGINPSPGFISFESEAQITHPLLSLTSMIAPSPDWFIAIHDFSLYDKGQWIMDTTINVLSYDSGTDSGTTFTSPDHITSPLEKIHLITELPLAIEGVVPIMGKINIKRIEQ